MSASVAAMLGMPLFVASPAQSSELPGRASLADLRVVGQVIVTVSAGSTGDETALRQMIERRLENAGIALDPMANTQLVANVDRARDTSTTGQRHFSYSISLSFQEPVRTERSPRTTFRATTWSANAIVSRFRVEVPFEMVSDALEKKVGNFLTAVAVDTAGAKERGSTGH
jgi:hypothetical protein